MIIFCAGAWFFGGLMIYLSITEGPNIPLFIAGLIAAAVPFVFILAGAIVSGIVEAEERGIGLLETAFGAVFMAFGLMAIYAMGGSFSPVRAFEVSGPAVILPAVFLIAGIILMARGIHTFFAKSYHK